IDRHHDPHQVRDVSMDWPARLLDQRAGPKGAGDVVQYLGVELLPAEPGAFYLRTICCRNAGARLARLSYVEPRVITVVGSAISSRMILIGFGVVVTTTRGSGPSRKPEHQHVPRLWIPPGGYFITPRCVVLRPPQALRLVGAVGCRNGPVRPGQPVLCWLVLRPLLRWRDRQQAALAFDHDIAGIGCGRRDQRDPAAAVMDDLVVNTLRT